MHIIEILVNLDYFFTVLITFKERVFKTFLYQN